MNSTPSSHKGFGLVEILVGAAVLSVAMFGISDFFRSTLRASRTTEATVQGSYLLEEGVEALKFFRDTNYTNYFIKMSTTTTYYLTWNGTNWATTTTNTLIDGKFERKFTLTDVKRDANSDIATSGTYDPNVKLVTVSVSWDTPAATTTATTTRTIQTYITNIFSN